jgi:hypothetical protein
LVLEVVSRQAVRLFIRMHDVTLSVIAVCIDNPHRSPLAIQGRHAAPTPTGFAEIVGDDFPVLHTQ